MLTESRAFAREMQADGRARWLVLCGRSGTGKTHLARRVASFVREHLGHRQWMPRPNHIEYHDGRLWEWRHVMERFRQGDYSHRERFSDDWFCGVDDFGSERDPTGFGVDCLLDMLNRRERMWTMLTTNLTMKQVADQMDARIASRLIRDGSVVVECDTRDYNLRK